MEMSVNILNFDTGSYVDKVFDVNYILSVHFLELNKLLEQELSVHELLSIHNSAMLHKYDKSEMLLEEVYLNMYETGSEYVLKE